MSSRFWTPGLVRRPRESEGSFYFRDPSDNECDTEASDPDLQDDTMVIGIDFGTTYSGAAWATAADFEAHQINLITSWPGTGREEGKAPTELCYEDGQVTWGYDVPPDSDPLRWFKLLLLKDEDLSPEIRSSDYILRGRKMLRENGKTVVELVADYLRGFWDHIIHEITKARGRGVIDALRFHVVITLPAIWKGYARKGMEEAAKKAGILNERDAGDTTLSFAPEPEAAALSTLCEPGRRVNKGDVYIICDAGGGTVDLISYEIEQANPLAVREVAEGVGGLCGGIFIDEAFEQICKNRLGMGWGRLSKAGVRDVMKGEWEQAIKPQFKVLNSKKEYIVSVPAEAFLTISSQTDTSRLPFIKRGRIHFKESDLQKAFTTVFAKIEKLIDGQIDSVKWKGLNATGIILVGGLGSSPYLYEILRTKYTKQNIQVLQSGGIRPRTAISRGAVFKGFINNRANMDDARREKLPVPPIAVTSTISRANFGVEFLAPFEKGKHLEEDRVWDFDEDVWMARNQMHWYLKRGDDVTKCNPARAEWYRTFQTGFSKTMCTEVYQCTEKPAPNRHVNTVSTLCKIEWVPDVSWEKLEWHTSLTGKRYKRLDYALEFKPLGATAEFTVYIDGRKQQGKRSVVAIQYDS
ncbi:actin-like ATPase domain-containing protein [Annulohypoxylon maeteangense]|uniref:actin-like ATPase domain-containing protein n=1 Tax=Annulohypoxylon maeteangense TaxID=1927788 RepID=UPI002007792B|nr:actin-like ATPase domain-containing protein [Annulohypoxylon maeteangense]KAI0883273.1 actin-like ATPase domain-containing protein [Annulohypoxylon maeteangense]